MSFSYIWQSTFYSSQLMHIFIIPINSILLSFYVIRDKKTRGYSSGKRMFRINAAAKRKPRRHNTDVSTMNITKNSSTLLV